MMCPGGVFFIFIFLWDFLSFRICKLVFYTTFEKITAIFFLICSVISFQSSIPNIFHGVVPKVTKILFPVFFQFFLTSALQIECSLDLSHLSSSSLIMSSAVFKLC